MIFPVIDLLDESASARWLARYFHPQGFGCPHCQRGVEQARVFRSSKRGLVDYRCKGCARVYNLYSGTIFVGCQLSASQAVLLLRGVCKGESSASLAEELGVCRSTVPLLRQKVQTNGYTLLAQGPVPDEETETDEMFQNAGEKRRPPHRSQRSPATPGQQTARTRHL
jgi:transposase-like protein